MAFDSASSGHTLQVSSVFIGVHLWFQYALFAARLLCGAGLPYTRRSAPAVRRNRPLLLTYNRADVFKVIVWLVRLSLSSISPARS
jgi:hypothetical protein